MTHVFLKMFTIRSMRFVLVLLVRCWSSQSCKLRVVCPVLASTCSPTVGSPKPSILPYLPISQGGFGGQCRHIWQSHGVSGEGGPGSEQTFHFLPSRPPPASPGAETLRQHRRQALPRRGVPSAPLQRGEWSYGGPASALRVDGAVALLATFGASASLDARRWMEEGLCADSLLRGWSGGEPSAASNA